MVREVTYLVDNVSLGEGCLAAVTARTKFGWGLRFVSVVGCHVGKGFL